MGKDLHVVSFSGGKDSTAMVLVMLEKNMPIDYILWADTGVEFPEIYAHIKKFDKWLQEKHGLQITQVKAEYDFWEAITHLKRKKGKNAGQPYGFPAFKNRWCTRYLKITPIKQFLQKIKKPDMNVNMYIGFSYNEINRAKRKTYRNLDNNYYFPLIENQITEEQALNICYKYGFDFDGIYKHITRASCYCCPFSSKQQIIYMYQSHKNLLYLILSKEKELLEQGAYYWLCMPQKKFWKEIREDLLKEFNLKD